jgi:hypothetical protein
MNPRTIQWQAIVTGASLIALALLSSPGAALGLAGAALALALFLNASYAYALGDRGRPERRVQGDRRVVGYLVVAFAVPLLAAAVLLALGEGGSLAAWRFTEAETAALLITLVTLFDLILLSSLVDWYYIRPRIDGVVWEPPCRSSGQPRWKRVTRRWYLHRGLATVAYIAFALVVALIIMLMLVRESPAAAGVIGGVSGIAGLLLIFLGDHRTELSTVATFVQSPAFSLGDDLTYDTFKRPGRGFVLHVAVPVTKLVPLDEHGRRTDRAFVERKNSDLAEADLDAQVTVTCQEGCVLLNPECVRREIRIDARRFRRGRRHLFFIF